ncbi:MAG: hypothetical protein P8Y79_07240 [Ignavibacteriaceae bacterium]
MSEIKIRTVENKKDLLKFIKFQWTIYKGNKHWVPPLIMERKALLNKEKNPFFKTSQAEYFLAEHDGKLVGRIAAIKNDVHLKYHNDNTGFFGFFECINDQEVANALFDKAKEWNKQKGLNRMMGPANPSSNDEWGMLIEGYDDSPRLLMTYNPPYYNELCENYGMKKAKDMFAWKIEYDKITSSDKLKRGKDIVQNRYKIKVRQLPLVEPSLVIFGTIDDKLAGAALVMQDYNQIFKEMNGKLFPFNFLKLYTMKKKITWARILTLGIIPEFQKKGLDTVLYWEVVERASKLGIKQGEASWVLEDNEMMNRGLKLMNAHPYKKYRIWEVNT